MFAAKRQQHTNLRAQPQRLHHGLGSKGIGPRHAESHIARRHDGIGQLSLAHPLCAMSRQGMDDLMAHHCCEPRFILGKGKQPRVDRDLAPRQREGIRRLIVLDHDDLPLKLIGRLRILGDLGSGDNPGGHALHRLHFSRIVRELVLRIAQDLLVGLQAHLLLLRLRDQQQLRSFCVGVGFATKEPEPHQPNQRPAAPDPRPALSDRHGLTSHTPLHSGPTLSPSHSIEELVILKKRGRMVKPHITVGVSRQIFPRRVPVEPPLTQS